MSWNTKRSLSCVPYVLFRIYFALIFSFLAHDAYGEVSNGEFAVGLNTPGVGARYFLSDRFSLEAKVQYQTDVSVFGFREYFYLNPGARKLNFLLGLENSFVSFKADNADGKGFFGEFYLGGEYFLTRRFSFQLDVGPGYVYLSDDSTKLTEKGLEFVANFGLNWYFGKP